MSTKFQPVRFKGSQLTGWQAVRALLLFAEFAVLMQ
jgi:hypothetical protein